MNSRTWIIIHVHCSLSEQRQRRRGRRRRRRERAHLAWRWSGWREWQRGANGGSGGGWRWLRQEERRRRKSVWGEDRQLRWPFCHWWGFGFLGRLRRHLLVEEKGVYGGFRGWRHGVERRKGGKCWLEPEMAGFLADFGPTFLLLWSMKVKSIYRRWKRDTLSLLVQTFNPWFDPKASQPLVQSSNDELSVLCRKNGWSGWPLWGGATASTASISPNGLY